MSTSLIRLPRWYDLHAHFRQDGLLKPLVQAHVAMGCAGVVAMPNTRPPLVRVFEQPGQPPQGSIQAYRQQIMQAAEGAFDEVIVPLYLSAATTPAMIHEGAAAGILRAAKYYPPHGTTGAEHGWHFSEFMDKGVFAALEECGLVLCVHGEEAGLTGEAYFGRATNAEEFFYRERMPRLLDRFPRLKVVAEHLTTQVGVSLVQQADGRMAASVTPQHLMYTVGDLLQNFKYHLYCLPLVKYQEDRQALREAVTARDNQRFFAGTDSAPHTTKVTPCGCAAGCFTGGVAPQLYAEAFDMAGLDPSSPVGEEVFRRFMVENGARFYGLPLSPERICLTREVSQVVPLHTPEGPVMPLPAGLGPDCPQGRATLNWRLEVCP